LEVNVIHFTNRGDLSKTIRFLTRTPNINYRSILQKYGTSGVTALANATPIDSGETRSSWGYEVKKIKNGYTLTFTNSNVVDSIPVIILLQYGHGTRGGTFVQGRDIINPVMRPIFDSISEDIWKEVTSL
jgi:hypothetical protein